MLNLLKINAVDSERMFLFSLSLYFFQSAKAVHSQLKCKGPKAVLPIDGPWRNASLKAFMRNVDAGNEKTGTVT